MSDKNLDWIIKVNQALFSIVIKALVSSFLSNVSKDQITPMIEGVVNSQIDLGGSSKYKLFVCGQPVISKEGLDLALEIHRIDICTVEKN